MCDIFIRGGPSSLCSFLRHFPPPPPLVPDTMARSRDYSAPPETRDVGCCGGERERDTRLDEDGGLACADERAGKGAELAGEESRKDRQEGEKEEEEGVTSRRRGEVGERRASVSAEWRRFQGKFHKG